MGQAVREQCTQSVAIHDHRVNSALKDQEHHHRSTALGSRATIAGNEKRMSNSRRLGREG